LGRQSPAGRFTQSKSPAAFLLNKNGNDCSLPFLSGKGRDFFRPEEIPLTGIKQNLCRSWSFKRAENFRKQHDFQCVFCLMLIFHYFAATC